MSLSDADRVRLRKLCGMLGSAHDGERASAGAFIEKLASSHKMSIDELMTAGFAPAEAPRSPKSPPAYDYAAEMKASQQRRQGQWGGFSQPHYKRRPDPRPEDHEPVPVLPMGWRESLIEASKCRALSRWEREFSRDIADNYSHRRQLSDRQVILIYKVLRDYAAR